MNREIKFRLWSKHKFMIPWEEVKEKPHTIWGDYYPMQYTGLKDKNGVEIYEGDILRHTAIYPRDHVKNHPKKEKGFITEPIEFRNGGYWYGDDVLVKDTDYHEVIGNIHENPELLN